MIKKRKMKKPTKQQLYNTIEGLKNMIDMYEELLAEFKIKKIREEITDSSQYFGYKILKRHYQRDKENKFMAMLIDNEYLDLYGVGKDEK